MDTYDTYFSDNMHKMWEIYYPTGLAIALTTYCFMAAGYQQDSFNKVINFVFVMSIFCASMSYLILIIFLRLRIQRKHSDFLTAFRKTQTYMRVDEFKENLSSAVDYTGFVTLILLLLVNDSLYEKDGEIIKIIWLFFVFKSILCCVREGLIWSQVYNILERAR